MMEAVHSTRVGAPDTPLSMTAPPEAAPAPATIEPSSSAESLPEPLNLTVVPPKRERQRPRSGIRRETMEDISRRIPVDVLRTYFNYPLRDAAQALSISVTSLKRLCRRYGVRRWPHRQLNSLNGAVIDLEAKRRTWKDGFVDRAVAHQLRQIYARRDVIIDLAFLGADDSENGDMGSSDHFADSFPHVHSDPVTIGCGDGSVIGRSDPVEYDTVPAGRTRSRVSAIGSGDEGGVRSTATDTSRFGEKRGGSALEDDGRSVSQRTTIDTSAGSSSCASGNGGCMAAVPSCGPPPSYLPSPQLAPSPFETLVQPFAARRLPPPGALLASVSAGGGSVARWPVPNHIATAAAGTCHPSLTTTFPSATMHPVHHTGEPALPPSYSTRPSNCPSESIEKQVAELAALNLVLFGPDKQEDQPRLGTAASPSTRCHSGGAPSRDRLDREGGNLGGGGALSSSFSPRVGLAPADSRGWTSGPFYTTTT